MSDWDFLHDMHHEGYSASEIADAAAVGYAPWQAKYIDQPKKSDRQKAQHTPLQQKTTAVQELEKLRQSGVLTRPQFLACKAAILTP